ncbi:MAG: 6,7-dimethyl-8-ribityllumazine synthase [Gammaproteobacteria bacterium RIFCSPHIGHO2_12_FULL_35_23]|nr:MAG: 6,7-dimethyl-8-ribityllumazine synthase [Gammaproteobacteria bacterium RIFCSPHIGHO2_12_FULL_35_23]
MKIIEVKDFGRHVTIALVVSRYNQEITDELLNEALARLKELEVRMENITIVHVPGAIEIPLAAKRLAQTKKYHAIIALGAVIRGETNHYDYVCQQTSSGCMQVMLEYNIPVVFGVLTTENVEQATDRIGGKKGYKGREAADTALEMISILEQI